MSRVRKQKFVATVTYSDLRKCITITVNCNPVIEVLSFRESNHLP